jgi:hypothetical protein
MIFVNDDKPGMTDTYLSIVKSQTDMNTDYSIRETYSN